MRRFKLLKTLKVRRQKCSVSSPQELINTPSLVSGSKEAQWYIWPCVQFQRTQWYTSLSAGPLRLSRKTPHRKQVKSVESVPVMQRDLKERLASFVLIPNQEKGLEKTKSIYFCIHIHYIYNNSPKNRVFFSLLLWGTPYSSHCYDGLKGNWSVNISLHTELLAHCFFIS